MQGQASALCVSAQVSCQYKRSPLHHPLATIATIIITTIILHHQVQLTPHVSIAVVQETAQLAMEPAKPNNGIIPLRIICTKTVLFVMELEDVVFAEAPGGYSCPPKDGYLSRAWLMTRMNSCWG